MSEIHKKDGENFLDYAERLIDNRQEYDLDKVEIYEALYGTQASPDHCRKALTTLKMTIEEYKKDKTEQIMESDNENKDLELKKNYKETVEINSNGTQTSSKLIEMSEEQSKDPNFLLNKHGFCNKTWEISSARNNLWNVYSKKDGVQTLYSSKITVKPRSDISLKEIEEHFNQLDRKYQPPSYSPTKYDKDGKMLEISIADLHIGKLGWIGDSGEEYDYNIARERFFHIVNDVLTRIKHYNFNKILFVWSHDYFHFDNIDPMTTAGTKQDTNMRWQDMYMFGVEMLIEGIDLLSQYAPVETFYIGSNHDKMTSFYAINQLYAWYRDNDNVSVNTSPKIRKYIEFGNSLIQFTHGSCEKKSKIGKMMPIEAREAWGRTKYHEVHAAHFHSEHITKEDNGIIIRYISSPTGIDNWHYENGYVGAVKKAQSFIWDKELGLTDILHSVIK